MRLYIKIEMLLYLLFCLFSGQTFGVDANTLRQNLTFRQAPFNYPLNVAIFPSKNADAEVTVCMHGLGADFLTGSVISQSIKEHVVSFNFPAAGIASNDFPDAYGTIQEILPAIYVIKQCLLAGNLDRINLYGFSSGGGAVINAIAVLNRSDYGSQLEAVGISQEDKQRILQAIQNGYVIIDCPLKSIEEILDLRECNVEMTKAAKRYAVNCLRPIDSINDFEGLSLNVLLNFQDPDEAVYNRDDNLFIQRLQKANRKGKTKVVISRDRRHTSYHEALWQAYRQLVGQAGM